ncbi:hypothetical protein RA267_28920, partial [Pseudomonas syringae pv. tagetis]|uniref:hypothetical protein n=1 Tax=Pseudomonas syringae group genomosp. 7 TaxID=251699 RepID=UPI00376F8995
MRRLFPSTTGLPTVLQFMRVCRTGASGLLVSSLGAFARFQANEAWTCEHQALVRARVMTGSRDVGE